MLYPPRPQRKGVTLRPYLPITAKMAVAEIFDAMSWASPAKFSCKNDWPPN